jgi:uncharacterized protein
MQKVKLISYQSSKSMPFHVRRKDREITETSELKQVLKTTKYVTIALCMENEPYLVSLCHGYDEGKNCLYFHCANEGKKLVYAKNNDKVWGQAILDFGVTDDCNYIFTCVQFSGKLSLINSLSEKKQAMEVLVRQLSTTPERKLAMIKPEKLEKTTMGKIEIEFITGKKQDKPKSNKLKR